MIEPNSNIDKLTQGCRALGLEVNAEQVEKLALHLSLLTRWNRKLNLTAIENIEDMVVQHCLDSLAITPVIQGSRLLDVGTGAGFPGFPLAIAFPELDVTLLDSRGKRIEFLRQVIIKTGTPNANVVHTRVEDFRVNEKFDTLVARAFSSLDKLVEQTDSLLQEGTRLLAMKGKNPEQEIKSLPHSVASRAEIHFVNVPFLDAERHLVLIDY